LQISFIRIINPPYPNRRRNEEWIFNENLKFIIMKKVFFAAVAGICVLTSVMAGSGNSGKINGSTAINHMIRDSVPGKKSDTSSYPKRDTTSMPRLHQNQ
jgi:hypothetical protein